MRYNGEIMNDFYATGESKYKTRIEIKKVRDFLKSRYGEVGNIIPLGGGEISQAFSFDSSIDGGYILRVNRHGIDGFEKDKYAQLHFSSDTLPIPKIIEVGQMEVNYSYSLSRKVDGDTIQNILKQQDKDHKPIVTMDTLAPLCIMMLDEIHKVDISNTSGYGYWGKDANGNKETWREFILSVGKDGWWADVFKTTFLEQGVYDDLYARLSQLVEFCPEQRYLIHGGFGVDNIITDGTKITGIIDWAESKYGDFLYDVAWLTFWPSDYDFERLCRNYYSKKVFMNYKQRILCYQHHIAINALSFYAQSMQKDKYDWTKKRIAELVRTYIV